MKAAQNFVGGILQPCIRLMQLAGCLARQLAELVTIGHMRKCPKYQIRTHFANLLLREPARPELLGAVGAAGKGQMPPFLKPCNFIS
jgi:hypothetical protein